MSDVTDLLDRGRARHLLLLVDTCAIAGETRGTLNETTFAYPHTSTQVYAGPCRVKGMNEADNITTVGERQAITREYTVEIPVADDDIAPGDIVTITASATDPTQVGLRLTVLGAVHGTLQTVRRLRCQEVTA